MGVEKIPGFFTVGGSRIDIQGARYWYGDPEIANRIGFNRLDDSDVDDNKFRQRPNPYAKEGLIQLVAVMKSEGVAGVGNSANNDKTRRFTFYCDPSFAESALTTLGGRTMDANFLPGSWKIQRVYRKLAVTRR